MGPRSLSGERTRFVFALRTLFAAALIVMGGKANAILFSTERLAAVSADASHPANHGFDGVGRIECRDDAASPTSYQATAWVVGSADTIITAAHVFFAESEGQRIDPGRCRFVLYDDQQHVRETARIRYVMSPWTQAQLRFDSSYDVAVIKLDRPVDVTHIPSVKVATGNDTRYAELIAFHSGVADPGRARLTRGTIDLFPASQLRFAGIDMRITRASRLFSTSANSTQGSSGGMYYDFRTNTAFGLHVGWLCNASGPAVRYDPGNCFNFGLRFDTKTVELIGAAVRDVPVQGDLIVPHTHDA